MDHEVPPRKRAGESEGELEGELRQYTKAPRAADDDSDGAEGEQQEAGGEAVVAQILDESNPKPREPSSLLPLPSAIPLPPPPEELHSLSPAEREHQVGPSPSQSQPLSQARSARGSRPYSTRGLGPTPSPRV